MRLFVKPLFFETFRKIVSRSPEKLVFKMALHYHVFKNDIENGVTKPATTTTFALDFELVVIGKTRNLSKCQITDTKTVLARKLELGAFNSNSFI